MLQSKLIQPADWINFEGKYKGFPMNVVGLATTLFDGRAGHTEIVYTSYGNTTITLGSNFDGVKFRVYDNLWGMDNVSIIRPKLRLSDDSGKRIITDDNIQELMELYFDQLSDENKTQYSKYGLCRAITSQFLDRVSISLWGKDEILPNDRQVYCTELAYEVSRKIDPTFIVNRKGERKIPIHLITPSDSYRSAQQGQSFIMLKDFA